jgi:hypothetical protein
MLGLAITVRRITWAVVGLVAVGAFFVVTGGSHANAVVAWFTDAGAWLARPFDGTFHVHDSRADVALNSGLAVAASGVAGGLVAQVLADAHARAKRQRRLTRAY